MSGWVLVVFFCDAYEFGVLSLFCIGLLVWFGCVFSVYEFLFVCLLVCRFLFAGLCVLFGLFVSFGFWVS